MPAKARRNMGFVANRFGHVLPMRARSLAFQEPDPSRFRRLVISRRSRFVWDRRRLTPGQLGGTILRHSVFASPCRHYVPRRDAAQCLALLLRSGAPARVGRSGGEGGSSINLAAARHITTCACGSQFQSRRPDRVFRHSGFHACRFEQIAPHAPLPNLVGAAGTPGAHTSQRHLATSPPTPPPASSRRWAPCSPSPSPGAQELNT